MPSSSTWSVSLFLLEFTLTHSTLQDGTLTDSIAAVEAAWGKVATDLGLDPEYVIAATHGKRAIDNLAHFRPEIKAHEMDAEVANFEQTILDFADAFGKQQQARSRSNSTSVSSGASTPALSVGPSETSSKASSRAPSFSYGQSPSVRSSLGSESRRPSFASRLSNILQMSAVPEGRETDVFEDERPSSEKEKEKELENDIEAAWEIEADGVDRSVKILPGVHKMIASIPEGRYAVATSGAKTYGTPSLPPSFILFSKKSHSFGVLCSVRSDDPRRHHAPTRDHHRRRQASQSRQARPRPLPPRRLLPRLLRLALRRLRRLALGHPRGRRVGRDGHCGVHEPPARED